MRELKADIQKDRDELLDALIWTTGSADFGAGGKARRGFLKIVRPLLERKRPIQGGEA